MKVKDLVYLALAFFTIKFLRKPMGKPETGKPIIQKTITQNPVTQSTVVQQSRQEHINKIPMPEKIMDHAAPIHEYGIEPHFKPIKVIPTYKIKKKPIEAIAHDISNKLDIITPFVPRKPEDMFRDHYKTGRENNNEFSF